MIGQELCRSIPPHESLQYPGISFGKIDYDESVQRISKAMIQIKPEKPPAQSQILLQQNRNASIPGFYVGNDCGKVFDVFDESQALPAVPPQPPGIKGSLCPDQPCELIDIAMSLKKL